jgi:hypothetical protein
MNIVDFARALPEVGDGVVERAERIERQRAAIEQLRATYQSEWLSFFHSIAEDWTPDEIEQAGFLKIDL